MRNRRTREIMQRRQFLNAALAGGALVTVPAVLLGGPARVHALDNDLETLRVAWTDYIAKAADLPSLDTPLDVSTEQWRERLPADAYKVLFRNGTERAGSSPLDDEHRRGAFVCRACDLPLFTSAMKFDSGTGWPSFVTGIPDHLATSRDFKLILPRTEYHCARCGGHQGHVFEDGPAPTGQRWCNNGVALRFVPADGDDGAA